MSEILLAESNHAAANINLRLYAEHVRPRSWQILPSNLANEVVQVVHRLEG